MTADRRNDRALFALVFILSSSVLLVEIGITRIFSALVFYHFAFAAVSLAMFGLSAGGLLAYYRRARRRPGADGTAPIAAVRGVVARLMIVFAATTTAGFLAYTRLGDPLAAGAFPAFFLLLGMFLAAALPFLAAGAAFALAFAARAERAGPLYAASLAGSALGCVLVIPLFDLVGGIEFMFVVSAITAAAALPALGRARTYGVAVLVLVLALLGGQRIRPFIAVGEGRILAAAQQWGTHELETVWSGWNSYSKVAVYSCPHPTPPAGWGLAHAGMFPAVEQMFLLIDNLAGTPISRFDGRDFSRLPHLEFDVTASPYLAVAEPHTLIIGPGGGRDVVTALGFGAPQVVAVEINPLVVEPIRTKLADFTGRIYAGHPRVETVIADGRHFVRRDARRFDVIQISLIDTWAATAAGAYSLSENSLYTVEAIKDYIGRLSDRGVLSISRFITDPPQQDLRILALYRQAAAELGIGPVAAHVVVTAVNPIATCLFKKTPFTPEEIRRITEMGTARGFATIYAPGLPPPPSSIAAAYHELLTTGDFAGFLDRYQFDVSPPTDDRPFFFQMVRWRDVFRAPRYAAGQEFNQVAVTTLATLLLVVGVLSLLVLLVPLALHSAAGSMAAAASAPRAEHLPRGPALLYFGTLGIGFMLFEMPLLQMLVLFLGHPVYATSVVLFALLLASGGGSLLSQRLPLAWLRRYLLLSGAGAALAALWIALVVPSWLDALATSSLGIRIAAVVLCLAPLGLLLGTLFPLGMRALAGAGIAPWMWAWNGSASVLGSVVAVVLAMAIGFRGTLLAAGAMYATGLLVVAATAGRTPVRQDEAPAE